MPERRQPDAGESKWRNRHIDGVRACSNRQLYTISRPLEFTAGTSPKALRAETEPFVPFNGFKFSELLFSQQRRDLITFPFAKGLQQRSGFLTGQCSGFHLLPDTLQFIPPSQKYGFEGDFLIARQIKEVS